MVYTEINRIIDEQIKKERKIAKDIIYEALIKCKTKSDYNYITGLMDMAYNLNLISKNENAEYTVAATEKYQGKATMKKWFVKIIFQDNKKTFFKSVYVNALTKPEAIEKAYNALDKDVIDRSNTMVKFAKEIID